MSDLEKEEHIWKKMLLPVGRHCSHCNKDFRCTGECPKDRWAGDQELEFHSLTACFCQECLKTSDLGNRYIEGRLRCCY